MVLSLEDLRKEKIFEYFFKISEIPRGSGNEKAISDFLVDFAKERNLYVCQDKYNNVIIKKPATKGYENAPGVIIQGHLDMVTEKNAGVEHDFEKDPLVLIVDGDKLKAKDTTLGADNGLAVAYAMALLDADDIPHPALEILMTTDEEVGLTGAIMMDTKDIKGKYFINLDSEEEGEFVISCAGGLRPIISIDLQYDNISNDNLQKVDIFVKGLKGGHSGMEIDKERANANIVLGRVLHAIDDAFDMHLIKLSGGMKDNVIPREAVASFLISKDKLSELDTLISNLKNTFKNEYANTDPLLDIVYVSEKPQDNTTSVITKAIKDDIIFLLMTLPNGVQSMSTDIPGLVESSLNLGRIYEKDGAFSFEYATRSSIKSRKSLMSEKLKLFAKKCNAKYVATKDYPEWPYKRDSKLLDLCVKVYEELYSKKPIVKGIHAGLESGVFIEKLPHLEAVSFGPNIYDVHSPDEWVSIESMRRTWSYLLKLLESIK